jgi:two-component system, chemotaxis family, protein-glutamate methylesterase/glutaminase
MTATDKATKAPSPFTCPECQGTLFEMKQGELLWFQCRVGHAYSVETLVDGQDDTVERLLWGAVKALEEQAEYRARLAESSSDNSPTAKSHRDKSKKSKNDAETVRRIVTQGTDLDETTR